MAVAASISDRGCHLTPDTDTGHLTLELIPTHAERFIVSRMWGFCYPVEPAGLPATCPTGAEHRYCKPTLAN